VESRLGGKKKTPLPHDEGLAGRWEKKMGVVARSRNLGNLVVTGGRPRLIYRTKTGCTYEWFRGDAEVKGIREGLVG